MSDGAKVATVATVATVAVKSVNGRKRAKKTPFPTLLPGAPETSIGAVYRIPFDALPESARCTECNGGKASAPSWTENLVITPRVAPGFGEVPKPYRMYHINAQRRAIDVPRFLGIKMFGAPLPKNDYRCLGDALPDSVLFKGTLERASDAVGADGKKKRPQKAAFDVTMEQLKRIGGAFIVLPCGFGKTVISIALASALRRKLLVVVHTKDLARQWELRFAQFFPSAQIGRVEAGRTEFEGRDVVIATVQTLLSKRSREQDARQLSKFGTVIFDEAHHIAARSFCKLLPRLPARYVIGLSATPKRSDGLENLLYWVLGEVAYRAAREAGEDVKVVQMVYTRGEEKVVHYGNGELGRPAMVSSLVEDSKRNAFIVGTLRSVLRGNPERKVLVLTGRRSHALDLHDALCSVLAPIPDAATMPPQLAVMQYAESLKASPPSAKARTGSIAPVPESGGVPINAHRVLKWRMAVPVLASAEQIAVALADMRGVSGFQGVASAVGSGKMGFVVRGAKRLVVLADTRSLVPYMTFVRHPHPAWREEMGLRAGEQHAASVLTEARDAVLRRVAERLDGKGADTAFVGVIMGGTRSEWVEPECEARVIVSSFEFCSEGFDVPRLDTLLMATSKGSVEQSAGRILRNHPDKQRPLVVDIVDRFSCFASQARKRKKYYDTLGYTVSEMEDTALGYV
jgi:superfamily II DNA or RNA helicase